VIKEKRKLKGSWAVLLGLGIVVFIFLAHNVVLGEEYRPYTVYSEEEEEEMKQVGHKYFLAMSQSTMNHPWRVLDTKSFTDAAEKYNLKRFEWTDGKNDASNQLSDIEDLISMKPDAIMMTALVKEPLTPAWGKCKRASIPLVVFDREIGGERGRDFVTFIGIDSVELGRAAGRIAVKALYKKFGEYKGRVALIRGTAGASVFEDRYVGITEVFSEHPGIEIIAEQDGDCLRANAMAIMENYLQKFSPGKIDIVLCENDEMGLGALQAIKAARRKDLIGWVVSLDGQRDALEAVVSGELLGTAECPPYYGDITTVTTLRYLEGKEVPPVIWMPFRSYDSVEKAKARLEVMEKYDLFY
jgi:ribose transport system substrate-binding protein